MPVGSVTENRRAFDVSISGCKEFRAGWSAKIQRNDGAEVVLSSKEGEIVPGPTTTLLFSGEGLELLFEFESRVDAPAIQIRAGIRNIGDAPVKLVSTTPVVAEWKLPTDLKGWLLTGFHPATPVIQALRDIHMPLRIHEYGGVYQSSGMGFLFGPVGEPTSYVNAQFVRRGDDRMSFEYSADMGGVRVDPGETRWGQKMVILIEPPTGALPRWADWVGKSHLARSGSLPLAGWGSWYSFGKKVAGQDLLAVVETIRKNPERLCPEVILIDEGHEARERFPEGLAFYAKAIAATGARPGLKLDFDYSPDPNASIREAVGNGFRFLKLGTIRRSPELRDPKRTEFEERRSQYAEAREAAGPTTYLLNSRLFPDRASVGYVDASRTGRMAWNKSVIPAIKEILRSYHLNGRWFAIDNDHFYLGTDPANVSGIVGGWPVVRTWMSMAGLSCGIAIASDPLDSEGIKPFWRNLEVMTPPAREKTEILDLGTYWHWTRLVGHVRRDWGNATVALLWNPEDKEKTVRLDFKAAGMDFRQRYAVWSFWENRYLGLARQFWTSPPLAPAASQHLRFTPIPNFSKPVLIGSNLHIYCGAAEIKRVDSTRSRMTIELTDAGARSGDVFIYSHYQPILSSMKGLRVSSIDSAGENVWRIRIFDRVRGEEQMLDLTIILPVMLQWWFWALIVLVFGSLLASVWRYVAWLKLQRINSLAEERARISRDLHDGMGSDLARIGLLAEAAARQPGLSDTLRQQLKRITSSTHSLAGDLDSVVWATNPCNDTLEHLARYLCHYAQSFLEPTDIGLRLDIPRELPSLEIGSSVRHNLFLAAKEAITNVVRHAGASRVFLRVRVCDGELVIEVEDDGRGILAPAVSEIGEDGRNNISSRMARSHGICEYLPGAQRRGTLVRLRIPLRELGTPFIKS